MSAAPVGKKTVYIDVDEEITGIINKVRTTNESIVALVLPKRATMLQSIVNMKLLKRAATQSDKKVVLITSEASLLPLAGAAGLHVAANLQSRPQIPSAPSAAGVMAKPISITNHDDEETLVDPSTPVGELAEPKNPAAGSQPIEIDNRSVRNPAAAAAAAKAATSKKDKIPKDKNKKVPNFQKFRKLIIAGVAALVLLIGFGYWALAVAPKATVTLRTESTESDATAKLTADTAADTVNLEEKKLPAISKELKKVQSEKVQATGEKDNGAKASGSVKLRNCTDDEITIPAGTGISNGTYTFITQSAVELDDDQRSNGNCVDSASSAKNVAVVAQKNGDQYNLSPRSYIVSGFSGVVAEGAQMSGGVTKTTRVVSAADVESAKKKITDKQNAAVEELKTSLKTENYIGLVDTFAAGTPTYNVTPAVDTEANEVTVSGDVTYTMLAVKEDDLKKLVADQADSVDLTKQSILSYGLDDATYEIGKKTPTTAAVTLKTKLVAGPEINQDTLKKDLAGKKQGDAESLLKERPGITEAKVEFKPFWVTKVPGNASKVNLSIEQANGEPITQ